MSQRDRRREPYPWTWEPAAAVITSLVAVLVVSTQVGRATANLAAGGALRFPPTAVGWLTSTPAVLAGNPAAGLSSTGGRTAGAALLAWSVAVTAGLLFGLSVVVAGLGWRQWGPSGMHGVASPGEVRDTLGLHRLRRSREQLRPDLYQRRQEDE